MTIGTHRSFAMIRAPKTWN